MKVTLKRDVYYQAVDGKGVIEIKGSAGETVEAGDAGAYLVSSGAADPVPAKKEKARK